MLAILLWLVISWGFGIHARTLATYAVYDGLTAVAVTLIGVWVTSLAILVGAELDAQLEGRRDVQDSIASMHASLLLARGSKCASRITIDPPRITRRSSWCGGASAELPIERILPRTV